MPLSSEIILFEVLEGTSWPLFRCFLEVLILGAFFIVFYGFRAHPGAQRLPNGLPKGSFGVPLKVILGGI